MTQHPSFSLFSPLGLALLLSTSCRTTDSAPPRGANAARGFLDAIVAEEQAPGVQYVHVDRDDILFEHVAGRANVARGTAVTRATSFHGYSVTKTLTAAAVFKLATEGALDLDAPISRWLPELKSSPSPTLRQTLAHVGGWPNPVPVGWVHLARGDAGHDESAFTTRILREHGDLDADPGEEFAYSNVGYLALGEIVTRVTNVPYRQYVTREFIHPLALGDDASLGFVHDTSGRHATGYVRRFSFLGVAVGLFLDRSRFMGPSEGAWAPFRPIQVDGSAYGGALGNARGFARYLQAILRREGAFTEHVVSGMFAPGHLSNGEPTGAAHGWFRGDAAGEPYLHHAGGGGGYYAEIRIYPRRGRASVLLMNRSAMKDDRLLDALDPMLLDDFPTARGEEAK